MSNTTKKIVNAIQDAQKSKTSAYDTTATVKRIEGNTAWVHIPGGVDETPAKMTIAAKEGDVVQVRVSGGTAFLVGNGSAPPTDDTTAFYARTIATGAQESATSAHESAEEAQEAADAAKAVAIQAKNIADDTNQYFWFTETGTDTGAHITEVPQDEWSDSSSQNYHSGGNLLARSNGIAVRNGMTELAQFGSSGIVFGNPTDGEVEITANGGRVDLTVENSNHDGAELSLMAGNFWLGSIDSYVGIDFQDNDGFGHTYYSTEIMAGPANGYYFTQDGPHNTLPNKVLWNDTPAFVTDQQTINLGGDVSAQWSGIVLVWSRYANGQAQNDSWAYQFVPKWHTMNRSGEGVYFSTPTSITNNTVCNKYVYIYDDYITGHASNSASGTGYANNARVLRAVIGV